jgi:hypothetical protein
MFEKGLFGEALFPEERKLEFCEAGVQVYDDMRGQQLLPLPEPERDCRGNLMLFYELDRSLGNPENSGGLGSR